MEATGFSQANVTLGPPRSMSEDEVRSLRVHRNVSDGIWTACFKPTRAELDEIERTGRVWLQVMSDGFPPVLLRADNPFAPAAPLDGVGP